MANQATIALRRMETSQPWGFRLKGGTDQGIQLYVEHVQPKGRAASAGLVAGDLVVAICGVSTQHMAHADVKSHMLRAGNELDITVRRDGNIYVQPAAPAAAAEEPRVMIDDQPLAKLGGPTYKQVTPKTYQVLEESLPADSGADVRPPSIFDRKKEDRSDYLKAKGSTIQKAYGEGPY